MALSGALLHQLRPEFTPGNPFSVDAAPSLRGFGMVVAHVRLTIGDPADYTADGLVLAAGSPFFLQVDTTPRATDVCTILVTDVVASDEVTRRLFIGRWDRQTSSLRLFKLVAGAQVEIDADDLTAGDLVYGMAFLAAQV